MRKKNQLKNIQFIILCLQETDPENALRNIQFIQDFFFFFNIDKVKYYFKFYFTPILSKN